MLEKLQAKRAVLVAQRDQIMANYNLTSGAIAIIDELIADELVADAESADAAKLDETGVAATAAESESTAG